jgi:hypothetical protein
MFYGRHASLIDRIGHCFCHGLESLRFQIGLANKSELEFLPGSAKRG